MPSPHDYLRAKAIEWEVKINETLETSSSVIAFGERDGSRVVLKIAKLEGDESYAGTVLKAFGAGAVRVHKFETGAVLLERLEPGDALVNLVRTHKDEEATEILAQVMGKLARHSLPSSCPTVLDWGRGFDRYLDSADKQIPLELVVEARDLYQELGHSQRSTMLLHGDLHHYNVLFDANRGWVVIDPKGVIGELEFEVGPILRNPVEELDFFAKPEIVQRRLDCLVATLQLDYQRTLSWSFAQAVLSAIWDVEDGYEINQDNPSLKLANVLRPLVHSL
jgi:streptomycin 6-kinase